MKTFDHRLNDSWWALRLALGLMPIIAGVDKYLNKLTDWGMYLSPYATRVVPVSTATFMHLVGVVEIIAGIIVLSRWTKIGSYIVMVWLIAIAANLMTTGMFYDLAVRDLEIAVGAFALCGRDASLGDRSRCRRRRARSRNDRRGSGSRA